MPEKKVRLTSLALAMSLGFMATLAGCELNPDGGGEGGEVVKVVNKELS